ncbi:unnamed protein product [Caenorhabditis sp. 36 PRJEB53466]|nr:unnamed protein product [Caenorhabditis sp. 36 PRJEB53466]
MQSASNCNPSPGLRHTSTASKMRLDCMFLSTLDLGKLASCEEPVPFERHLLHKDFSDSEEFLTSLVDIKMACLFGVVNKSGAEELLTTGRFGTVHIGICQSSMNEVAVKEYHPNFEKLVMSANKEGSLMNRILFIQHPAIVQTFSVAQFRDICYSVMEKAQTTLQDDVFENGKYGNEKAKGVTVQIMGALEFLHGQGLVHGNLHTRNILIFEGDVVKLSDLASQEMLRYMPYNDVPIEILMYLAPELQYGPANITTATDMWSLGICMFLMVTGRTPFWCDTRDEFESIINRMRMFCCPHYLHPYMRNLLHQLTNWNYFTRMTLEKMKSHPWITGIEPQPAPEKDEKPVAELNLALVPTLYKGMASSNLIIRKITDKKVELEQAIDQALAESDGGNEPDKDNEDNKDQNNIGGDNNEKKGDGNVEQDDDDANKGPEVIPEKIYKTFGVYVFENVREEWDSDNLRIERCQLICGDRMGFCIRLVVPSQIDNPKKPSLRSCLAKRFFKKKFDGPILDYEFGDYAPMQFHRYKTGLILPCNMPPFSTAREAQDYICHKEAKRLWRMLKVSVCWECRKAGSDALRHDDEMCLYNLLTLATDCPERVYYTHEERHNFRFFSLKFRLSGTRAPVITRFGRATKRMVLAGCEKIAKAVRSAIKH